MSTARKRPPPNVSPRVEALLVAAVVALVYGLTRSGNHSETEDSVAFAVRVRDDPLGELLEGTHLVYLAIGRAFRELVRATGLTADPLVALQLLDTLLAAAAVGGLWLLVRRAGGTRGAAAAAAGIAAFSYAFWRNAVDAEVYALSAFALVGCLAAAWSAARSGSSHAFALLGAANGIAVLAHVTNVLFAGVAGAAVVLATGGLCADVARAARLGAAYVGSAAGVVVTAYAGAAAVHGLGSPSEFWSWFRERSGQPGDFGTVAPSNVVEGAFGSARALVGGHFALSLDPVVDFLTGRFAGKTFSEERFFLADFPAALAVALLLLALAAAALVVVLATFWLRRPVLAPETRTLAILAVAWLVPYTLFLLWWDPLNIELWYSAWLPAAVLLALPLTGRRRTLVGVAAAAALFAVNLVGSVLPQRDESRDLWRAKAAWYGENARLDDLIVSNGYVWTAYLRYLLAADVVDIEDFFREAETDQEALAQLRRRIASAPRRVLVSGEAFHPFADRRISCIDAPRTCAIASATARELRDDCELVALARDPLERVWRCPRTA